MSLSNVKENSEFITGILILLYFITRVILSYSGPWNLVFGTIALVNTLLKIGMFLRTYRSDSIWKSIKPYGTYLLADLLLAALFLHYGGLI